ncbi:DUF2141 domain-containing protein [Sphingobium sp. DEHP117]|uniref:DUF2141 domain-containing protein n=1 Tax=Sphingobium sp. DEHP117 TaxID=2993436 RepID=UPI0027D5B61C|nr:DUF2141 domain-containing protein [Sphingobium sp. DEHP117]MDQ4419350.1 DUF2141 domain-containing protein [Sphingobium sp. DEHP117]
MLPAARLLTVCALPLMALALSGSASPTPAGSGALDIEITGIRSAQGVVRLALCPPRSGFPDCGASVIRSTSAPAGRGHLRFHLADLPEGPLAVSVFHDANGNGRMDSFVGIPREGYGFSGNPPFRPRAPRFEEAQLNLSGHSSITISLRYLL